MLNVAIVGTGNIGNTHAKVYAAHPEVKIVAVCDAIPEKAKEAAEKYGAQGFTALPRWLLVV